MGEEVSEVEVDVKDLDGFFKIRRDEGKEDEEILREIFEIDPDADIKKLEEITKLPSLSIGRIKGQVSIRRKRDSKTTEKSLQEGEMTEAETRQFIAQNGREGMNKIKRGFLKKTLAIVPNMSPKTAEWILHKWDINPKLQNDPNAFYEMLHNDAGLKPNQAISIAKDIFGLEEQYADILDNQGIQPILIAGSPRVSGSGIAEPFLFRRDTQSEAGPFEVRGRGSRRSDEPAFLTLEDYRRLEREKDEKTRMQKLEEKVDGIGGALGNLKDEIVKEISGKKSSDETTVEEIPIDADGKPCAPELAVSVKRTIRGGSGVLRTDPVETYLKLRQTEKPGLDAEGVRRIFKDEIGSKTGPSPEVATLQTQMTSLGEQIKDRDRKLEELKDKLSERDKQDLKDQITGLREEMRNIQNAVSSGGVNSVEGMITSVGTKLMDKTPIKAAGDLVKDLLTPSGPVINPPAQAPAVTSATPGTSSGILDTLRKKGLVTTVRERVVQK